MNDEVFARLVAEEVKNRVSDVQREFLAMPENWGRWKTALEALLDNLDRQLVDLDQRDQRAKDTYSGIEGGQSLMVEQLTANEDRRQKIVRFRFHVETRLNEVHRRIVLDNAENEPDSMANFLRRAIETHRELVLAAEEDDRIDAEEVDEALWASLDGSWTFPGR